jgi:hypothetical protein
MAHEAKIKPPERRIGVSIKKIPKSMQTLTLAIHIPVDGG